MHSHDRHTIDSLPDPIEGQSSRFWDDDTQYTIDPHHERWIVHRHGYGSASPLVTLHRRENGWRAAEVNGADSWDGATVASVLRPLL